MKADFTVSDSFRRRADSAAFFEAYVASRLTRLGLHVVLYPVVVAAPGESLEAFHRTVDLRVRGACDPTPSNSGGFSGFPVEVKSQNMSFTDDPSSYPKDSPLVCSQSSWGHKCAGRSTTRYDQLYVSRITGGILWLPAGSPVTLGVEVYDSKRNELYKAVATSKQYLRSVSVFAGLVENA